MRRLQFIASLLFVFQLANADERGTAPYHYNQGARLFNEKDYRRAITEFEEAHRLSSNPGPLFDIAVCYRNLGDAGSLPDLRRAVEYFRRYLTEKKDAADRASVEREIADVEARIRQGEAPPAPAAVPTPAPVPAVPAPEPPPAATPPPATPVAQPARLSTTPLVKRTRIWIGAGLTAGGAVVAATGGLLLLLASGNIDDANASSTSTLQKWSDLGEAVRSERIAGPVLIGIGSAALVAGIVTLAVRRRADSPTAWWFVPTTNGVSVAGSLP